MTTATVAAEAPPAPLTFKEVLANTVMRRIWYAQIVSLFGDFLALFAVISVVSFHMHGTPTQITWVQIAYMLPLSILGPLAGVFVDRWPLKPTLVTSDLLRAGLVVLLVFAKDSLWQVYAVLFLLSTVSSFFAPAQTVTIRSHVPRHGLLSANALMQIAMTGIRIVGPATAGLLVAAFGAASCYALDVVSFLASAALIASVTIVRPQEAQAAAQPAASNRIHAVWIDLTQGLRFILHHAALLFVVAAMAAGLFTIGCFGPLISVYVRDSLHAGSGTFGLTSAMIGVGLILGTQGLRRVAMRWSNQKIVLGGLAGIGLGALLMGAVAHVAAAILGTLTIGLAFSAIIVPAQTLMQQETPIALAGRIGSTVMSVVFFAQILGLVLSGTLADHLGVRVVFLLCAALGFLLAVAGRLLLRPAKPASAPA